MNNDQVTQAKDKALAGSLIALCRAARMGREHAMRTNTAIIVLRDNKIVRVTADELRKAAARSVRHE